MLNRAIRPDEIVELKQATIPGEVFDVFNRLIAESYGGGYATIKQKDVVKLLVELGFDRHEIFRKGWLDVEGIYEEAGWQVTYDKPGYNETYEATFTFKKVRK